MPWRLPTVSSPIKGRFRRTPGVTVGFILVGITLALWGLCDVFSTRGTLRQLAARVYYQASRKIKARNNATQIEPLTVPRNADEPPHPTQTDVAVWVDASADNHPISPYIYGMSFAPRRHLKELRLGLNRWGGNDKSRYNWVHGNAVNAARDWHWANRPVSLALPTTANAPSAAADQFVALTHAAGTAAMLTVPTIGWLARDADTDNRSHGVPSQGGAPLPGDTGAIEGYDPAQNRARTSIRSAAHKKAPFHLPPDLSAGIVYQDEWIYHLTRRFGKSTKGGVRFYAMDNEPDLWDTTHTDVHPGRPGYDELRTKFLEYAQAVKAVDADACVTGPVSWGWMGYQYAPLDRGDDNFRTHANRKQHGDEPFLLWFLKQVRDADAVRGKRTLDVLDVHYYPQSPGLYPGRSRENDQTRARRLRATRSLWDENYVDESWIEQPIRLLPRLKEWISAGYPGTHIGITEWNWGGGRDISGGLAVAETLGVFGREDVYLANYWAFPPVDSPAYLAFKLYRNADGRGHGFGEQSCYARSAAPNLVSCFAAKEKATDVLTLILINKMPQTTAAVNVHVSQWYSKQPMARSLKIASWQLSTTPAGKLRAESSAIPHPLLQNVSKLVDLPISLPPYSATLLRLSPVTQAEQSATAKLSFVR